MVFTTNFFFRNSHEPSYLKPIGPSVVTLKSDEQMFIINEEFQGDASLFPKTMLLDFPVLAEESKYNKILKNMFSGMGSDFENAANDHNIPVDILMSICLWETGEGTSEMLRKYNNPGGNLMYNKATKKWQSRSFKTLKEGLDFTASNLSENYWKKGLRTVTSIKSKYAPTVNRNSKDFNDPKNLNVHWVKGVNKMKDKINSI